MADLENDIMGEDYLDSLLNAASEPLITEDDTEQENDEQTYNSEELDAELNDLLTSIPDELLNKDDDSEDNLDDLLKDIENMDIGTEEEVADSASEPEASDSLEDLEDLVSDFTEPSGDSTSDFTEPSGDSISDFMEPSENSQSGFAESSGSEELDEIHRLSEELLNSHNSDDEGGFEDLLKMLEAADNDNSSNDTSDDVGQSESFEDSLEDIPDISELDDIPDKSELDDKKNKKKKKKKKLFGKNNDEEEDRELVSDENKEVLKSVEENEESYMDFSALEGLEGFEDFGNLGDLEDRSKSEDEKSPEEIAAEKKALKEAKKQEKAEKKAEKKRIKEEKNAEKKRLKEEKKKEKQREKELHPEEKIKFSIRSVILMVSIVTGIVICSVFGGKSLWYSSHIDDATDLLIDKKYTEAYYHINGLSLKKKDIGLYNQIKTIMYVERELDSYHNCVKIGMEAEALDALLKGVDKYNRFKTDADEYGVSTDMNEVYTKIISELSESYGISEENANELVNIKDSGEYSVKLNDIIKEHKPKI